jgi:hypothetical protein
MEMSIEQKLVVWVVLLSESVLSEHSMIRKGSIVDQKLFSNANGSKRFQDKAVFHFAFLIHLLFKMNNAIRVSTVI